MNYHRPPSSLQPCLQTSKPLLVHRMADSELPTVFEIQQAHERWPYVYTMCSFLQGSIGFLVGAVLSEPVFVLPASVLIDEWFGMCVGYLLGSICFLSGSYLAMAA